MKQVVLVLGLTLVLAACAEPSSDRPAATPPPTINVPGQSPLPGSSGVLDDLTEARNRWAASGYSTYRYVFEDDCGMCQRYAGQVVVWNGDVLDPAGQSPTIEEIFEAIERAASDGRSVEAVFDPVTGHPSDVWIDREARAVDGGLHWLIESLAEGLPGEDASLVGLERARAVWQQARPTDYEFRMSILCDCAVDGSIWIQVKDDAVTDWRLELDDETAGGSISPITIDTMFSDLAEMMASDGGLVETGIRFSGSAQYDADFGYPVWVGLDLEILEPDSLLATLPPRMVFVVTDFRAIDPAAAITGDGLDQAMARWRSAGLVDYEYQLTVHDIVTASLSPLYTVTVAGGRVVTVTLDGQPVTDLDTASSTIDDLFALIQEAAGQGMEVEALYDAELGYPVLVIIHEPDSEAARVISLSDLVGR
ncbi:MAG: DUF6174 domain-containing protein [Acidimicrobiia bacterium]|nr:DUF6174 domain-containing protein [Acidimicrobiia bacterium]